MEELFEKLSEYVENTKVAYEDTKEWRKEIRKDVKKCIEILENW